MEVPKNESSQVPQWVRAWPCFKGRPSDFGAWELSYHTLPLPWQAEGLPAQRRWEPHSISNLAKTFLGAWKSKVISHCLLCCWSLMQNIFSGDSVWLPSPPLWHVVLLWGSNELPKAKGGQGWDGHVWKLIEVSLCGKSEDFGVWETWMGLWLLLHVWSSAKTSPNCASISSPVNEVNKTHHLGLLE